MTQRYYLDTDLSAEEVWLTDQEAHHLLHVMRGKVGENIELFNGRGIAVSATVVEIQKKKARLQIHSRDDSETASAPSPPVLILATAIPKGERFRWLVEKATELGVTQLVPLTTARSVVAPRESKIEKHQQYIVEACKQSGRNTLMQLEELTSLQGFLSSLPAHSLRLVGSPVAENSWSDFQQQWEQSRGDVVVIVGPEGGFTAEEQQLLQERGVSPIGCSPYILRTETAGVALCSVLLSLWNFPQEFRD